MEISLCLNRRVISASILDVRKLRTFTVLMPFCMKFQLIFEGIRGKSYHGDIAIDDVSVAAGSCNKPGKMYLNCRNLI